MRRPRRASTPASTRAARSSSRAVHRACRPWRNCWRSTGGSASGTATASSTPPRSPSASGSPARSPPSCPTTPRSCTRAGSCAAWRAPWRAMGRRSYEGTPVTGFRGRDATGRAALVTPNGEVRAPVIVLAGEAYLTELPPLHRQLVPLWSLIVLTEPVTDAQWAEIGWANRETLASTRLSVDYLSRTEDGRILFGGRGAPYRFGSPIRREYDRHDPTHEMLRGFVRSWFPSLARNPVHARLGRAARDAAGLAPDDGLRSRDRHRDGARLRGPRGVDDEHRGPHADRPDHRRSGRPSPSCRSSTTTRGTGRSSRSAGSACATRSGPWVASTTARRGRASRRRAGAWRSGSRATRRAARIA